MRRARSWAPLLSRVVLAAALCGAGVAGVLRVRAAAEGVERAASRSSAARAASDAKRAVSLASPLAADAADERAGQDDGAGRLRELRTLVAAQRYSFFSPAEIGPAELASRLLSLVRHTGLSLRRISSEARGRDPLFSLALSGGACETATFFSEISRSPRLWSIPYLHLALRRESGSLEVELKIAPAIDAGIARDKAVPGGASAANNDAGPAPAGAPPAKVKPTGRAEGERSSTLPPEEVALLFRISRAGSPAPDPSSSARPAPELRYVAFLSTPSGERRFVFKSLSSGRLIVLSKGRPAEGFRLAALLPDGFVLEKDGASFRVSADWRGSR